MYLPTIVSLPSGHSSIEEFGTRPIYLWLMQIQVCWGKNQSTRLLQLEPVSEIWEPSATKWCLLNDS